MFKCSKQVWLTKMLRLRSPPYFMLSLKIKLAEIPAWKGEGGSRCLTLVWEAIDSWWLLGERGSVISRDSDLKGFHTWEHMDSTEWILWGETKQTQKLGGKSWGWGWRGVEERTERWIWSKHIVYTTFKSSNNENNKYNFERKLF